MTYDVRDFGAVGDGATLCTASVQQAIDACAAAGGGRVALENGTYLCGKLILRSFVELHIGASATLLASSDCGDFPESTAEEASHVNTEMLPRWRNRCFIFANECEHIAITGTGTINCSGHRFVVPRTDGKSPIFRRIDAPTPPRVVFFTGCRFVKVEDVTMTDQPSGWSYWIHDCDFVSFTRCRILAEVNYPNNDGIHINCSRNVTVSDCDITCGDDCLVVRANSVSLAENKVCEKVSVTNCNLTSYSGGVRVGWINDGVIRNCVFSNLVMTDTSCGVSIIIPNIKRGTPSVSLTQTSEGSVTADVGRERTVIENISFNNIVMQKVSRQPIFINVDDGEYASVERIDGLYFSEMHASSVLPPVFRGRKDAVLKNIYLSNCTFHITDGSEFDNLATHGFGDVSPEWAAAEPHIVFRCVDGLVLNGVTIKTDK